MGEWQMLLTLWEGKLDGFMAIRKRVEECGEIEL